MSALEELKAAEDKLGSHKFQLDDVNTRRSAAEATVARLALPDEPIGLTQLADDIEGASQAQQQMAKWQVRQLELEVESRAAEQLARLALEGRGFDVRGGVLDAYSEYEAACRERASIAQRAAQRPSLEAQLADRERVETMAAEAQQRNADARHRLRSVAEACGVTAPSDDELARSLQDWQEKRTLGLASGSEAQRNWGTLLTLLDGKSFSELEEQVALRRELAERSAGRLELGAVYQPIPPDELDTRLQTARDEAASTARAAAMARGQIREQEKGLPVVADAEEEFAAAELDLAHLKELGAILAETRNFLVQAQERVHRDIAPVLRAAIDGWLPTITAGRYTETLVDPESLQVRVRSNTGEWREAQYLSHGTAEQIYLLLRVAMAEHLTRPGEVCPLILDDVTVQCDERRKKSLLELLHELSKKRQVILFSQETDVLRWAETNLKAPRDNLVSLDPSLVGT
jgi:uncharacterized protein YhaN